MYYYMRSLAASNPILTAKESLMSLFEETKRKVSLGAGLWDAAPACAREHGQDGGFWTWRHSVPTSKKLMREAAFRVMIFGVVWAAESLVSGSQGDLAELSKGCRLLWFAAWPWHAAQSLLYPVGAPHLWEWIRETAVPLCPRESPQIQHTGCHTLLGLGTAFLVLG